MSYPTTTFPTTVDAPSNPGATDTVATFDHAGLEDFQNAAIVALENKVGANSSAVTTTHDYKLSGVTGSDKAVSKTGTETLTNKTLTSPTVTNANSSGTDSGTETLQNKTLDTTDTIGAVGVTVGSDARGDIYFRNGSGKLTRLANGGVNTVLHGSATDPAYSAVVEADITLADNTTNDVSTSKHGFVPKAPDDSSKFLRGDGTWAQPTFTISALTLLPKPNFETSGTTTRALNTNTNMQVCQIIIPYTITVNKVTMNVTGVGASGTLKVAFYTEDGQTRPITFTTATISGTGLVTTTLGAPVTLSPGIYYFAVMSVSTANITLTRYNAATSMTTFAVVSGKATLLDVYTVTADTIPATISPTGGSGSPAADYGVFVRIDN